MNDRWDVLSQHLDRMLNDQITILYPSVHDELLWDDENFIRSRRYFWAINALAQFHSSLTEAIQQWEKYYDARIKPYEDAGLLTDFDFESLEAIRRYISKLDSLRSHFTEQRESTKSLRDGVSWKVERISSIADLYTSFSMLAPL